jgi:hypothetical protein
MTMALPFKVPCKGTEASQLAHQASTPDFQAPPFSKETAQICWLEREKGLRVRNLIAKKPEHLLHITTISLKRTGRGKPFTFQSREPIVERGFDRRHAVIPVHRRGEMNASSLWHLR